MKNTFEFHTGVRSLGDVLGRVAAVVPSKSTLPLLETVHLAVSNKTLAITGSDAETTVSHSLEIAPVGQGAVNVPGKLLNDIIRALPDTEVTFSVEKNHLRVRTREGDYHVATYPGERLGVTDTAPWVHTWHPTVGVFRAAVQRVAFAVSNDQLRPALMGVLFDFGLLGMSGKRGLSVVATDGHRLSALPIAYEGEAEFTAIVPPKALALVLRNIEKLAEDTFMRVAFNEAHVEFTAPGAGVVRSRLIAERYPNWYAVVPKENNTIVHADPKALAAAVKRVALIADESVRTVRLTVAPKQLTVRSVGSQGNEAVESVPCDHTGDTLEIGMNASFLAEALAHVTGDDARLCFSTPTRAVIIDGPEDHTMLVMPVRLNA